MAVKPYGREGYKLLHEGALAMAQLERNGIRVDVKALEARRESVSAEMDDLIRQIKSDKLFRKWKRLHGEKTKATAGNQLADLIFGEMGHPTSLQPTPAGKYKADVEAFAQVDIPMVKLWSKWKKLDKVRNTYLEGIHREVVDGYLHPAFNLHNLITYRSSSSGPNFQNMPIRDPILGEIIRSIFIPRKGRVFIEFDYSGVEVRVAACYNKDPVLIDYINDPSKDMHRDMAAMIYFLEDIKNPAEFWKTKNGKMIRYCAKNMYVFPEFYGSYYIKCAANLWKAIDLHDLQYKEKSLLRHLRRNGIDGLGLLDPQSPARPGTFEHHLKHIEDHFWNERFSVYRDWKNDFWSAYQKRGYFDMLTGFRYSGLQERNKVINGGIQGSAFHCLLWTLIETQKEMNRRKWDSLLCAQIHDSMLGDIPEKEVDDFLYLANKIATVDLCKHWDWIIVPMAVEADIAEENWFKKHPIELPKVA